jgi:hypothetical protein
LRVVHGGISHGVVGDQVGVGVVAHVVFMAVVGLVVLLGPACVGVFLRVFMRVVFPFGRGLALLDSRRSPPGCCAGGALPRSSRQ